MTNGNFNKIISSRIKSLRLLRGLTIEQLAYQSDLSKGGLSEIERNMKEPRAYTIFKICSTLNISMSEFFKFKEIDEFQKENC